MTKKVYDLAKEYNIPSKDFVTLLQQANVPVKNHMSNLTEQQEKYFKNNYAISAGKLVKKSGSAEAKEQSSATPQARIIKNADNKKPQQSNRAQNQPRAEQGKGKPYPKNNNGENQNGTYQKRDSSSYQKRDSKDNPYKKRDDSKPSQYRSRNNDGNQRGDKPDYRQKRDNPNYQPRRSDNAPYSKREGSSPYQNKDKDGYKGNYSSQRGAGKPVIEEKPLEKPKSDKFKNNAKQKNDIKARNKESFFDEKPMGKLDNTKKKKGSKSQYKVEKAEKKEKRATSGVTGTVSVPESITVSELSEKVLLSPTEIIKTLMSYGIMASINQSLDFDTVSIVCEELGISVELEKEEDLYEKLEKEHFEDESLLKPRPPIITVMGHVDHGKTSLLDAIRQTSVTSGEAGGITQHIGAYTVTMRDNPITFIDTPGHEAFTAMRSRGASVTDIAVLVVAADDGVKPQTIEAINHAKAAGVPIVVAINKIDKPTANPDKVKQELTEYGVVCEEWGGDVICAPVSAKKGEGVDNLLDMILLVAEVEDLKANFEKKAIGTVIESRIDKHRGVTATLLVKSGTLKEGDFIVIGTIYGKVRVMTNHNGQKVSQAGPSMAVEFLGLNEVPGAGDKFFVAENEKEAKRITDKRKDRLRIMAAKASASKTLEDIFKQVQEGELKEISLIVKTDVAGSFEAIKQELEKLNANDDGIKVSVIHGGVGDVSETDAQLASASDAIIVAFNVKPDNKARAFCDKEGVEIRTYSVIYDIIDDITATMKGLKEPEYEEIVTGQAEVRATFKVPNIGFVAGSYITDGCVKRSDKVRVFRNGEMLHEGNISSLKRFQDDVKEVSSGYECGIGIEKYDDIKENDTLEFFSMREIKE